MAQQGPLNPVTGSNNLLALVARKAAYGRGDVGYADTGEPTKTTVTVTTATVVQVNFPTNGVGNQPNVSCGAWGIIMTALSTATVVGSLTVDAVDTTATSGGHVENLATISLPSGDSGIRLQDFSSSLAAGADAISGLTNVIGIRFTITLTTTGGGLAVQACAVGTP